MAERDQRFSTAETLMRRALDLLDANCERGAAIHLQRAIDVLADQPVPRTEEEADAMLGTSEAWELQKRLTSLAAD